VTTPGDGSLLEGGTTAAVIRAFFRSYGRLGFGFLESVCVNALVIELEALGIRCEREVRIDVWYNGVRIGHFRVDLLVNP
jgi:GxxExxY protein